MTGASASVGNSLTQHAGHRRRLAVGAVRSFVTTQMRRDHRVPPESAHRRLSSTSRIARTTEIRATASPEKALWGLTRAVASQKEFRSGSWKYVACSPPREDRSGGPRCNLRRGDAPRGGSGPVRRRASRSGCDRFAASAGPPRTPNVPARRRGAGAVLRGRGGLRWVVAVPTVPASMAGSARPPAPRWWPGCGGA